MCEILPITKQELKQVHGMGKTRIEKYGSEILQVVKGYCDENEIETSSNASIFEDVKQKKQR
jgi:hypothetical protein